MKKIIFSMLALILLAGVTLGQTLQKGVIIGVHHLTITLDPDVTMNQYLDFINNKYLPEFEKHFDGWKVLLMKGDRGENENSYALMYYIESVEARDKYFDSEGQMNDVGNSALEKMIPTMEELDKLGTYTREYTDWVIQ